ATSNICTAQVLLAVIASMYAVYHGPEGIKKIAQRVQKLTALLATGLKQLGYQVGKEPRFDTLKVTVSTGVKDILAKAKTHKINLRYFDDNNLGISVDETSSLRDVWDLWQIFAPTEELPFTTAELVEKISLELPANLTRTSAYLTEPV
ncbi:MAG: glycine dehydrogenase (aminomethyl-transferring), partial [bacterium]